MIELKPCPFCGYSDIDNDEGLYQTGQFFCIVCGCCMASVVGQNTVETIKKWNARPDPLEAVRAEVEELERYSRAFGCSETSNEADAVEIDEVLEIIDKAKGVKGE